MKRDDVKAIFAEATDEQLDEIMHLHGSDVEKVKGKVTELESALKEKNTALETLNSDFEQLKTSCQARLEEERESEREANILNRYNAVAVGKDGKPLEWSHEAIKADYLRKFTEALSDKENEGKSDADIFKSLTENDGAAFKVPSAQTVFGGAGRINNEEIDEAKINAIMGIK